MAAVTVENSGLSGNDDMGAKHEEAHSDQHKFQQEDEPNIETLTGNKKTDLSTVLVIDYAIKNGYIKPLDEWKKYNAKLKPSRRKKDYGEYVGTFYLNFAKGKQRQLDNKKTTPATRKKIAQELAAVRHNGMAIDSSLFYLSNTRIYEKMGPDELKKYRKFEKTSFERFFNSDEFKKLCPQLIRAEIHFDEMGAMHLQTQQEWFHRDKRGRVSYAKRAEIEKILIDRYGSEEELQNRLDVLCQIHHNLGKTNKSAVVRPGIDLRPDQHYLELMGRTKHPRVADEEKKNKNGSIRKYASSAAERRTRLLELWRIELMHELQTVALQTAKEMHVDYEIDRNYITDARHRSRAQYLEHQQLKGVNDRLNNDNQKLSGQVDDKKQLLTSTKKEFATAAAAAAKKTAELDQANKSKNKADSAIRQAYTAITGRLPVDKEGKNLSTEKTAEALKRAVNSLKTEADKQEKRRNEAQKKADNLTDQNIEAMASLMEKQTQTDAENKQLEKLKKQRQQRKQEAQEEQTQFQEQFQQNEKLLSTQTESLTGLRAQTKEETAKLNRLKRQQQQLKNHQTNKNNDLKELKRKAGEYDKIEAYVGTPPIGKSLSEWVKSRFEWWIKQNSILNTALETAKKLRTAAVKGLRVLGKLTGKEYDDALTGNNDDQITAKADKAYNDWRNSGGEGKKRTREEEWEH